MKIACPRCKKTYNVPDSAAGKKATCKECELRFMVPTLKSTPSRSPQKESKSKTVQPPTNPKPLPAAVSTSNVDQHPSATADPDSKVPRRRASRNRWLMLACLIVFLAASLAFGAWVFLGAGLRSLSSTFPASPASRVVQEPPKSVEDTTVDERVDETLQAPVVISPQPVDEPTPFEFRGLPLGADFKDVKAAYKLRRGSAIKDDLPEVNTAEAHFQTTGVEYAGEKGCTVNFKFWEGRLYEIHVFLPGNARVDLIAAFTAKYGEPSSSGLSSLAIEGIEGEAEIVKAMQDVLSLVVDGEQSINDSTQWANQRYRISIHDKLLGGKEVVFVDMQLEADVANARAKAAADQL